MADEPQPQPNQTTTESATTTQQQPPTNNAPATLLNEPDPAAPKLGPDGKPIPEAPTGAPEAYADFKLPEGVTMDKESIGEASGMFKDMNLSQDNAQKLLDFHNKRIVSANDANMQLVERQRSEWREAVAKDPELGPKISEVKANIGSAFDAISAQSGGPQIVADFKAAMDLTGAGDNPAFIKFFSRLSALVGEGRSVSGRGPSPQGQKAPGDGKSSAQTLWPNLPSAAPQRG